MRKVFAPSYTSFLPVSTSRIRVCPGSSSCEKRSDQKDTSDGLPFKAVITWFGRLVSLIGFVFSVIQLFYPREKFTQPYILNLLCEQVNNKSNVLQ